MIQRCTNSKNIGWHLYGGRGINVCDRWRSFDSFLQDMGPRPEGTTLDRIDNDGNYQPANCRWVTNTVNCRNKRGNRLVTYQGVTQSVSAWADQMGVNYFALIRRFNAGWPTETALFKPFDKTIVKRRETFLCCGRARTPASSDERGRCIYCFREGARRRGREYQARLRAKARAARSSEGSSR